MSWLTAWYNGLGLVGSVAVLLLTVGVLLVALAQHWFRYVLPLLWMLVLALGPISVLSTGTTGDLNVPSVLEVCALPVLLGLIPLLGWRRQRQEQRGRSVGR